MRKWIVAMVMVGTLAASGVAQASFGEGFTSTAPAATVTVGGTSGLLLQNELSGARRKRGPNFTPDWLRRGGDEPSSNAPTGSGRLRRMAARQGAGGR